MTTKVWVLTAGAAVVLLVCGWLIVVASVSPEALRSRHSRPSTAAPPSVVVVTANGKLYHRRDCTFIHGPARVESGEEAVAEGYTPCTRCMKQP
jgi:hypothetical protein